MKSEDLSDQDIIEIGRQLGWDYAHYGLEPRDMKTVGVREGYLAGKASQGEKRATADRYVRKILQLRASALRRGKAVDQGMNVELLKAIDYETCPVTLETLTHSELKGSDWSIDRINNNGAYADGNLVVLSTRANEAKGNKSFEEVHELAAGVKTADGLTPREWLRVQSIMYGPCASENEAFLKLLPLPLATIIPNRVVRPSYFQLQRFVLDASRDKANRNFVFRQMATLDRGPRAEAQFQAVVKEVRNNAQTCSYAYDALVDDDVQSKLWSWVQSCSKDQIERLKVILKSAIGGENLQQKMIDSWSLGTRGKLTRPDSGAGW